MAKALPALSSFSGGIFSPTLSGRVDYEKYPSGCETLENFLITVQGPAVRRGGTIYTGSTKSAGKVWISSFEFNVTQSYILEWGDQYLRFYTAHAQLGAGAASAWSNATAYTEGMAVVLTGVYYVCILAHTNHTPPNSTYWRALTSGIYEIPTPYSIADLTNSDGTFALSIQQSADVLYIANSTKKYPPQVLTRYGDIQWWMAPYVSQTGPFTDQNQTTTTMQASATSGAITITASAATFSAGDVGRLIRMDSQDITVKPWTQATAYVIGNLVRNDGKTYIAASNATSGAFPPVHLFGSAFDGGSGVNWTYHDAGYGVALITAFTDSTHVDATVVANQDNGLSFLPADVVSATTKRWALGEWTINNYPTCVGFFRNRLWWARGIQLWGSVPNDFTNLATDFFNEVQDDCGISTLVYASDVNSIIWLQAIQSALMIGTQGGEFTLGEITTNQVLSPTNYKIDPQSKRRCRQIQPQICDDSLCFVQASGKKLFSLDYNIYINKFSASDLSIIANLLANAGIIQVAFQSEPYSIIWCVTAAGELLGFTYNKDEKVMGWHLHPIGGSGTVESVAVIPNITGSADDVWISVHRTINGSSARYIEYINQPWDGSEVTSVRQKIYVDSAKVADDMLVNTMTVSHLIGETVQIVCSDAVEPDQVVPNTGIITFENFRLGTSAVVGLACPAKLVTNRIEAGGENGTSQGQAKRINSLVIRLLNTLGGNYGLKDGTLDEIEYRDSSMDMNAPPPPFSGDKILTFPGGTDTDCQIEIQQTQPLPMTIIALYPNLVEYQR